MNPLLDAALQLQQFCQRQNWQFCYIGGLAVQRWGEPRLTQDADMTLLTCSAEDLIVHKAFAGRPQDWLDIETILIRQKGKLKPQVIWDELVPLAELKEEPEIVDRLRKLITV